MSIVHESYLNGPDWTYLTPFVKNISDGISLNSYVQNGANTTMSPKVHIDISDINYLLRLCKKDKRLARIMAEIEDQANFDVEFAFPREVED